MLEAIFPIDDWKAIQATVKNLAADARTQKASLLDAAKQSAAVVKVTPTLCWKYLRMSMILNASNPSLM